MVELIITDLAPTLVSHPITVLSLIEVVKCLFTFEPKYLLRGFTTVFKPKTGQSIANGSTFRLITSLVIT
jgi:hypothetical protein